MTRISGHGGTHWAVVMIAGVLIAGGCSTAKRSSQPSASVAAATSATSPSVAPSSTPSRPPVEPSPTPARPRVSKKALFYFFALATTPRAPVVVRWSEPVVTVRTDGVVSAASQKCLSKVISDFNALTATTDLYLTPSYDPDITVQFAPVARFPSLDPDYIRGNDAFANISWNEGYSIINAHVLIGTTGISDTVRCHHIRDELTRSTGLMGHSDRYLDSVFNFRSFTTTRYSEMDKQIISLLYSGAIGAGYSLAQVTSAVQVLP